MAEETTRLRQHHQALEQMLKTTSADDVQTRLRIITVLVRIELGLLAHKPRATRTVKDTEKETREHPFGGRPSTNLFG